MSRPQIVHVEGYFRKDGTWVPPHTREWDGIKNPARPKSAKAASEAVKTGRNAVAAVGDDDDGDGDVERVGGAVPADGDGDDEDFEHLVDEESKPLERREVRIAGRVAARGIESSAIPEDRIREWRDKDGKVLAVGWVGSRLDEIIWIRTAKGESIRINVDDLRLDDQEFLDNAAR
jgi:hypothetical protein